MGVGPSCPAETGSPRERRPSLALKAQESCNGAPVAKRTKEYPRVKGDGRPCKRLAEPRLRAATPSDRERWGSRRDLCPRSRFLETDLSGAHLRGLPSGRPPQLHRHGRDMTQREQDDHGHPVRRAPRCPKTMKLAKAKANSTRYAARQKADLTLAYDVVQANVNNYLAQVSIDNWSPISRLDNWNLTWEWKRDEFIYGMRGAYTLNKEGPACIYSPAASYYKDMDFTPVYSCEKRPIIVDLPPEREKDKDIGNVPLCCKNGTLLPPTMDPARSRAVFQMTVYKVPPDLNRTALYPPQNWKIAGKLNPQYVCGQPVRVSPQIFPDPTGLMSTTPAVPSWQVACNITRPKKRAAKCCVSFSAFYNDSVVPCNTCACGCGNDTATCEPDARAMLLPPEALLVPFDNRTAKARAWAKINHWRVPNPMPCADNCGVTINWHVVNNYKSGWSVRMTIFNWQDYTFKDWFAAVTVGNHFSGYDNVYSFNGTRMDKPFDNTIFMQGLPGLAYLDGITDGKTPGDPRVPGKQQSIISFKRKDAPNINIGKGEGFPKRVYFDGEECALPDRIPKASSAHPRALTTVSLRQVAIAAAIVIITVALLDSLCLW
ncbi:hypothetical protein PR202_ga29770 [Eleusine coracana subsp. coracana]|uniref:COBRA C-terminal domain-containing protein n=1 Tax=Eleusine coracana subsp. coracana TaxID=191504 RepID=A0AAV5DM90_ELECO|nr:hypothetical protein PR202_ga29770 [Eleusine coracana subsp. coracana]